MTPHPHPRPRARGRHRSDLRRGHLGQLERPGRLRQRHRLHDRQERRRRPRHRRRVSRRTPRPRGRRGGAHAALAPAAMVGAAYVAILGGAVPFLLFFGGLASTASTQAAFLHKTLIVWVALLAIPLLKEKLTWWHGAAIALLRAGPTGARGRRVLRPRPRHRHDRRRDTDVVSRDHRHQTAARRHHAMDRVPSPHGRRLPRASRVGRRDRRARRRDAPHLLAMGVGPADGRAARWLRAHVAPGAVARTRRGRHRRAGAWRDRDRRARGRLRRRPLAAKAPWLALLAAGGVLVWLAPAPRGRRALT